MALLKGTLGGQGAPQRRRRLAQRVISDGPSVSGSRQRDQTWRASVPLFRCSSLAWTYIHRCYIPRSYIPRCYIPRSYIPRSYIHRCYIHRCYIPRCYILRCYIHRTMVLSDCVGKGGTMRALLSGCCERRVTPPWRPLCQFVATSDGGTVCMLRLRRQNPQTLNPKCWIIKSSF